MTLGYEKKKSLVSITF